MNFQVSEKAQHYQLKVKSFIDQYVIPEEQNILSEIKQRNAAGDWTKWEVSEKIEILKAKAKSEGLWNLFLPNSELGTGLTNSEYSVVAK